MNEERKEDQEISAEASKMILKKIEELFSNVNQAQTFFQQLSDHTQDLKEDIKQHFEMLFETLDRYETQKQTLTAEINKMMQDKNLIEKTPPKQPNMSVEAIVPKNVPDLEQDPPQMAGAEPPKLSLKERARQALMGKGVQK